MGGSQQEIQESRGIIIVPNSAVLGIRKPFVESQFRLWTHGGVGHEEKEGDRDRDSFHSTLKKNLSRLWNLIHTHYTTGREGESPQ